jgi:hypothetical protein
MLFNSKEKTVNVIGLCERNEKQALLTWKKNKITRKNYAVFATKRLFERIAAALIMSLVFI